MRYVNSTNLAAALVASALAFGVAPGPAKAQLCSEPKKGCVVTKDIKKNAVDSSRVKNNNLKDADIKDGTLTGADIKNNSLTGTNIQDKSLSGAAVQDGGIEAADLTPDAESDTLRDLNCTVDQVARFIDDAWECVTGGASYVFISNATIAGNAGIAAMDQACADSVTNSAPNKLPAGTYRAWLSTDTFDAKEMLPPGPFYLPDGTLLALSKADLLDEFVFSLIDIESDATQTSVPATAVWTGTKSDGTHSGSSCGGWTSDTSSGTRGARTADDGTWTDNGTSLCDLTFLLYCIQVE